MLVTICLLRKILTSLYPKFEGSRVWVRSSFFPVLVVSAFNCLHTGGINISWVGLRLHHTKIIKSLLPSKVNGATVGDTVDFSAAIDCACMTTIEICCNSSADSVLCVCYLVACIGAGEWIPGTLDTNFRLTHLITFLVCSIDGNFMAVAACFLVMRAWTVPALNHATIGMKLVLMLLVSKTIYYWLI